MLLFSLFSAGTSFALQNDGEGTLIEYLSAEKANLSSANAEAKSLLAEPKSSAGLVMRKKQNKAMIAMMMAKIDNLENFLINERKEQQNLGSQLKKLQQAPVTSSDGAAVQEQINYINAQADLNNKTIELIIDDLTLARRYLATLSAEEHQLSVWQAKINERQYEEDLQNQITALVAARAELYRKNIELQQAVKSDVPFASMLSNEARVLLNNQSIVLIEYQISELDLKKKLSNADYLLIQNQDVKTMQSTIEIYKNILNQLATMKNRLQKLMVILKTENKELADGQINYAFSNMNKIATNRLRHVEAFESDINKKLEDIQLELKKQLSLRQTLAAYHLNSWPSIAHQLLLIPAKFYGYLKSLGLKISENYVWQDLVPMVIFWLSYVFVLFAAYWFNRLLRKVIQSKERSRLSAHLYDGVLVIIYRNVPLLTVLAGVIMTCFFNHVPFANYELLIDLLLVWLIFRSLILVARLVFLERITDVSGQDARLYYRLKWLLIVGGWITALMMFSQKLPLTLLLQDIFNRLFMLFLLAVSFVVWKSKDVIPQLLLPVLRSTKRYFRNAVSIFSFLVPLILFTTAMIGLIGYINLAWSMSRYQAYLLLLVTGYILIRGLTFDLLELFSEWMVSELQNGWLWIEVILKPLDKILRLVLLLLSILILFQLFGWYSDAFVMKNLQELLVYPLINISGVHITLQSTGQFFIAVCVLIWLSKWTREFCYRWLFRNTKDLGVRNSLSVFTQYAVIVIGTLITLRILGLDFTGMSMVLGGLAVGMGFGLRDFASNIVGGLMLLVERPVREGDLITIGEYEGRVAHIGIRSMRVSSWDNMEVLIPNAETFSKPFTNWTHQDSIIRTVIPIKVSREDSPIMVQQLILDVLAIIPEILCEPSPQVYLKQIDDALIEFEVRYFINVDLNTLFEIRSKVLFAITAQFNAAGIKPPIPPYSVEVKPSNDGALSHDETSEKPSTERS